MNENLHLIFGADEFFVDLKTRKFLEGYPNYSLEIIEGDVTTIADLKRVLENVIEALRTMDFFSNQKCVWLRATNLLSNGSPAFTEGGLPFIEHWLEVLKKLPQDTLLIISASPVDKRTKLFKTLQELAVCEEMEEKNSDAYLHFLVKKLSKELQMDISADAYELMIKKLNHQPRAIANEFEKLACLKNFSGCISSEDVTQYTPTLLNEEFFEPVEAFYSKNKEQYIRSLRNHFILNKEMRSVLSMMQNRNRLLIQIAALNLPSISKTTLEREYSRNQTDFGPLKEKNSFCIFTQNPWYLSRLKTSFTLDQLLEIQQELVLIFDRILQTPQQACFWMESLVRFF